MVIWEFCFFNTFRILFLFMFSGDITKIIYEYLFNFLSVDIIPERLESIYGRFVVLTFIDDIDAGYPGIAQ